MDFEKMVMDMTKPPQNVARFASDFVMAARTERSGMVQTADQYNFLVACLTEFYKQVLPNLKPKTSAIDIVAPLLANTYQKQVPAFLKSIS